MANNSVLANFIVSALARESDLEVFRITRDELGSRRDFSIVIVVDEEMDEIETINLKEIIRGDSPLLLMRVSLKSRNVYVDDSYQLNNPGMEQVVDLLRDFSRKNLKERSEEDSSQKKMKVISHPQTIKYDRTQTYYPFGRLFALTQAINFHNHLVSNEGGPSHKEITLFFYSFFLHYLRLKNPGNVTLPIWQGNLTGTKRW
jgi:hypothetical protein